MWGMPKYIERRRRRWYAVLDVPKDLRDHFGTARFVKSLETESQSEAERLVLAVVAGWKAGIHATRSGLTSGTHGGFETQLSWRSDLEKVSESEEQTEILRGVLEDKIVEMSARDQKAAKIAHMVALGETFPLDQEIEGWLQSLENEPKTIDMKRSDVKRFTSTFRLSHEVTKAKLRVWTLRLQSEENLKGNTIRRVLSSCRGYWTFLQSTAAISSGQDIFEGVGPKKQSKVKAAREDVRQPLTVKNVNTLLVAAMDNRDIDLTRLIWIAMWTGCRIEEICSLRVEDVQTSHIIVRDAKTPAGNREIPIHPRLGRLMSQLRECSSDGFILSELTLNKYGDRSNAIGKRFGRLKAKLGFGPAYVFHSIRKTVATEFENYEVPENVAADILGHEKKTMTYGVYSGGTRMPLKKAAIAKLNYPVNSETELRIYRTR